MRNVTKLTGTLLLMVGILVGSALMSVAQEPKSGGTLTYLIREEPDNLNPQITTRAVAYTIFAQIFEPLMIYDNDLKLKGLLVDSWKVSDDQLTWTFHLKQGIKFHDGEPFNAKAVEFTFSKDMFFNSPNAWELEPVKEVKAVGEYTVEFVLKTPFPLLLDYLADAYTSILPPEAVQKYGDAFGSSVAIGTGPLKFKEWKHGESITLVRNDDYHHAPAFIPNKGPTYVDKVVFRVVPEDTTRIEEIISPTGLGDITLHLPPKFVPQTKAAKNVQVVVKPAYGVQYMVCNVDNAILKDQRVRKAIAHAIDKDAIVKVAWAGIGWPAYGLMPPSTTGYWPGVKDIAYKYDPEKAKTLLEQAGWVDTNGDGIRDKNGEKLELHLITFTLDQWSKAAQIIKAQLEEIGFKIDIEVLEVGATYDKAEGGEFDLGIFKILYNLGSGYINFLANSANIPSSNFSRYVNPELDKAINTAMTAPDEAERQEALNKAQRIVIESAVWLPLVIRTDRLAAKDTVGGIDILNKHPWWNELVLALELYKK